MLIKQKSKTKSNKRKQKPIQTRQNTTQNVTKTEIKESKEPWRPKLPRAEIQHIQEEENYTTPSNTTSAVYTSYRKTGVYEWKINTSAKITNKHLKPDKHIDGEFEW